MRLCDFICLDVLPSVYDNGLSFYDCICKINAKVNDLVNTVNGLPEYIKEEIEALIDSGEIEKAIADILTNFMVCVKFPPNGITPAKGDGVTNDTETIKQCIDYATSNGNLAVFFPSGSYMCESLSIAGECAFVGQGKDNTRLVALGGLTAPFVSVSAEKFSVNNINIDGNIAAQANKYPVLTMTSGYLYTFGAKINGGKNAIDFNGEKIEIKSTTLGETSETPLKFTATDAAIDVVFENVQSASVTEFFNATTNNAFITATANSILTNLFTLNGNENHVIFPVSAPFVNNGQNNVIVTGNTAFFGTADFKIKSANPIEYKTPSEYNQYFDKIPMKDESGEYAVLVANDKTGALGANTVTFASVEAFKAFEGELPDNTLVICASNNGVNQSSKWVVKSPSDNDISVQLASGKSAVYQLENDFVNIGALGLKDNISEELNAIISKEFKNFYFPEGQYTFNATFGAYTHIKGNGIYSNFHPYNGGTCITLDGDYITVEDIYINDPLFSGVAIAVSTTGTNKSVFKNIKIENCRIGFTSKGSIIWDEFYNVEIIGCADKGFFIQSSELYFNNNTFYSCLFESNVNEGIYLDVSTPKNYGNTFVGCCIEGNASNRFEKTSTADSAIYNNAAISFIGCYFESNGDTNTKSIITNYNIVTFVGCVFILEKNIVNNKNQSPVSFIGCKDYSLTGNYIMNDVNKTPTAFISNMFEKTPTIKDYFDPGLNKMKIGYANFETLDCSYPFIEYVHNSITSLSNTTDGTVVTVINGKYQTTVSASVMADGKAFTIMPNTCASFAVFKGKLYKQN